MTVDRRAWLRGGLAALGTPLWGRVAFASPETDKRYVVIVLRGALDGLAALPPVGDPAYVSARRGLALPDSGTGSPLPLGPLFALHPSLSNLREFYRRGELVACHAVAIPVRERSHFEAQAILETGFGTNGGQTGWMNRLLRSVGPGDMTKAIAFSPSLPLILRGSAPAASYTENATPGDTVDFMRRVSAMYDNDPVLKRSLIEGLKINEMATGAFHDGDKSNRNDMAGMGAGQPSESFTRLATLAGRLMAQSGGPRFAVLESFGWDTHVGQGTVGGILSSRLAQLDAAIQELALGLKSVWSNTIITVITEFGRTVAPNGSGGTDHGTGGVAFLVGGNVAGGRVLADWAGLDARNLFEGRDVRPTMDVRSLLKAGIAGHLGVDQRVLERDVFPESAGIARLDGLFRA